MDADIPEKGVTFASRNTTLAEVMRDKGAPAAARVAASNAILDRGFGKPMQSVDASIDAKVTTKELPASVDDFV